MNMNDELTRMQRWTLLNEEERHIVAELAQEQNKWIWQVFDELYPEESDIVVELLY